MKLLWLGHASFKITSREGFVIYIDPFAGDESEYGQKADLVLVSHEGYHHLSYEKVRNIRTDATPVLSTKQVAYEVSGTAMKEGEVKEIGPVKVKAVHAYSTRTGIGREKGTSLGFLINVDGKIIYFAGSTDLIPEMNDIVCDIALLPVSPTRTMSPQHALQAVQTIKPKLAIPMHYGLHAGTVEDAELFKELVERETNISVIILEEGKEVDL
jgi:L-ascorbate metabolism protein UlaG (beta-lactamase superfamily)